MAQGLASCSKVLRRQQHWWAHSRMTHLPSFTSYLRRCFLRMGSAAAGDLRKGGGACWGGTPTSGPAPSSCVTSVPRSSSSAKCARNHATNGSGGSGSTSIA